MWPALTRSASRAGWAAELSPQRILEWLAALAAGLYLVGFVAAGTLRLLYAYPLETQEDASVQVVRHILLGQPMYAAPALDYVPVIYPPLYFWLSAGVSLITGEGFLPLRLVSLLASIAAAALIYKLVQRETRSRGMGLVSAGLFVGSTTLALRTLDLARVDALGVCLLLGAVWALRTTDFQPDKQVLWSAVAGLLAGLAVLTKQTDALAAAALVPYAALSPRKRLAPFLLVLLAAAGAGSLIVYAQSGGWARVYLLDLPRLHQLNPKHLGSFWSDELLPQFTLPLVVAPLFFVGLALRGDWRTFAFYALVSLSFLGMAWGGWANRGSSENVLVTAFAVLAILFGLGVNEGLSLVGGGTSGLRALRGYVLAVCVAEFLIVAYNPRTTVPLRSDSWAGARLSEGIGALPGSVYAPGFGEWSRDGGKGDQPAYGSMMEIGGAFGDPDPAVGGWQSELNQALLARRYDYVLLDPTSDAFFLKGTVEQSGYVDSGPLFQPNDEFYLWRTGAAPDARVYIPVERMPRGT
jgi:hypothetical protein